MIRLAEQRDLPDLIDMCRAFHEEAQFDYPFNEAALAKNLATFMQNGLSLVAVSEQDGELTGVVSGVATSIWQNPDMWQVTEQIWWVRPQCRGGTSAGRLLKALEKWSKVRGASWLQMADVIGDLGPMYRKRGYERTARIYEKRLQ